MQIAVIESHLCEMQIRPDAEEVTAASGMWLFTGEISKTCWRPCLVKSCQANLVGAPSERDAGEPQPGLT